MNKQRMNRFLKGVFAMVLTAGMIPAAVGMPSEAADSQDLQPTLPGVAVIPASVVNDEGALNTYVLNRDAMLVTDRFQKTAQNYTNITGGAADTLSSSLSFKHSENKKWSVAYRWNIETGSPLELLFRGSQLGVGMQAKLTPDSHNPVFDHGRKTDRAQAYVNVVKLEGETKYTNVQQAAYMSNSSDDGDGVAKTYQAKSQITAGGNVYPLADYREVVKYLEFVAGARDCSCGSSQVASTKIYLYDTTSPKIKAAYPSDGNGNMLCYDYDVRTNKWVGSELHVGLGEVGYFALECTEYIRFADNTPQNLTLTLDLIDRANNLSATEKITASLSKIAGSKLVFSFTAPDTGDYMVTGISPANASVDNGNSWVELEDGYTLALLDKNGNSVTLSGDVSKVDSLITDIAGNPLEWDNSIALEYRIYTDTTNPGVKGLSIGGSMISSETNYEEYDPSADGWMNDLKRDTVFAGVKDTVSFTVEMDEELVSLIELPYYQTTTETPFYMNQSLDESKGELSTVGTAYLNWNRIKAVTNIYDENDQPVIVNAVSRRTYYGADVQGTRTHTFIGFGDTWITEGMYTKDNQPLKVTALLFEKEVSDLAGNLPLFNAEPYVLDGTSYYCLPVNVSPKQQIFMDITKPTVTVNTVTTTEEMDGDTVVTVPFTVADTAGAGEPYASGCSDLTGSVTVKIGGAFRYAVSMDADAPNTGWEDGTDGGLTFTVVDGVVQYLHIRLTEDSYQLNPRTGTLIGEISVTASDYAGNIQTQSRDIAGAVVDKVTPTVTFQDGVFIKDSALATFVTVSDNSYLENVTYQWGNLTPASVAVDGKTCSFDAINGPSSGNGTVVLSVTVQDVAGNQVTATKEYPYHRDTAMPDYVVTGNPGVVTNTPQLRVNKPQKQDTDPYITMVFTTLENGNTYLHRLTSGDDVADITNLFETEADYLYTSQQITLDDTAKTIETTGSGSSGKGFVALMNGYNGIATVRLINMPISYWMESEQANGLNQQLTAGVAPVSDMALLKFRISMTPQVGISFGTFRNGEGEDVSRYVSYPGNASQPTLRTLTGLSVPITLQNKVTSIGLEVVDFANSYAVLLDEDGREVQGTKMTFTEGAAQTFVVSERLYGHTAKYQLKVVVRDYLDTTEDTATTATYELFMDDTPFEGGYPSEYAVSYQVRSSYSTSRTETFRKTLEQGLDTLTVGAADVAEADTGHVPSTYWARTGDQTITFDTNRTDDSLGAYPELQGNMKIKVYNKNDPNGKANGVFTENPVFKLALVDSYPADGAYDGNTIYLKKGETQAQELVYCLQMQNGTIGAEKSLLVTLAEEAPAYTIQYTPDSADSSCVRGTLIPNGDYSTAQLDGDDYTLYLYHSVLVDQYYYEDNSHRVEIDLSDADSWIVNEQEYYEKTHTDGTKIPVRESWYVLVDSNFNSYLYSHPYIPGSEGYADTARPFVYMYSHEEGDSYTDDRYDIRDGQLNLSVLVCDPDGTVDKNSLKLHIQAIDSTGDQTVVTDEVVWDVPMAATVTDDGRNSYLEWNGTGYGGIYHTRAEDTTAYEATPFTANRITEITVWAQLPPEFDGENLRVFVTCTDTVGHSSVQTYTDGYVIGDAAREDNALTVDSDTTTSLETGYYDDQTNYIPIIKTAFPSKIISPARLAEASYSKMHRLPVYDTSAYEIVYEDLFGKTYTATVQLPEVMFGRLMITVSEGGDGQPVEVRAWDNGTGGASLDIWFTNEADVSVDGTVENGIGRVECYENGMAWVSVNGVGAISVPVLASALPDTSIAPVTAVFYDRDGYRIEENTTENQLDMVTVQLSCSEELTEGGTALTHVFRAGARKGDTFTFDFADMAGNTGSLLVTLPFDVVEDMASVSPADDAAPVYTVRAYVMRGNAYRQMGSFESDASALTEQGTANELHISGLPALAADETKFSGQSYRLAFTLTDDSPAKIVVKTTAGAVTYDSVSDSLSGLTVGETTLTWSGETASPTLYIYAVDHAGNVTEPLTLTLPAGDNTPPEASISYDKLSKTETVAYLIPGEKGVVVYNTESLTYDEVKKCYYYTFTANGSYTFRFGDAAGNASSLTATVGSMDTAEIAHVNTTWLANGGTWNAEDIPATNQKITAVLTFSKEVALVQRVDGLTEMPRCTILGNRVTLEYNENTEKAVTLRVFGLNNTYTDVPLPRVTQIDKDAPAVTVVYNGSAVTPVNGVYTVEAKPKQSVKLTFTADQPGVTTNGLAKPASDQADNTTFTCSIKDGEYTFVFADAVGNRTVLPVQVTSEEALAMMFADNGQGNSAVSAPSELGMDARDTVYVSVNKTASVTLGTVTETVPAGTWVPFTVPEDGTVCVFTAKLELETVYAYMSYRPADLVPPTLTAASHTVMFPMTLSKGDIEARLLTDVTARDNRDDKPQVTVDTTAVDWTAAGSYTVTYTATDASGNTAQLTRTLILSASDVQLYVDGNAAYAYGTLTLDRDEEHRITVTGTGDEWVYLVYKSGYKTIGQMKTGTQVLLSDAYTDEINLGTLNSGFYTLYLRTQDRTELLVYLYVS